VNGELRIRGAHEHCAPRAGPRFFNSLFTIHYSALIVGGEIFKMKLDGLSDVQQTFGLACYISQGGGGRPHAPEGRMEGTEL
jgi:hypothetical protein